MPRERQIVGVLYPMVWNELQRRIDAAGRRGERGAEILTLNEWLLSAMGVQASLHFHAAPPAPPTADDDDLMIVLPEHEQ